MDGNEVREIKLKNGKVIKQRTYAFDDVLFDTVRFWCPEKSCVFCKNCTDVFWDYTNGPYAFICEKDKKYEKELIEKGYIGECEEFEEYE